MVESAMTRRNVSRFRGVIAQLRDGRRTGMATAATAFGGPAVGLGVIGLTGVGAFVTLGAVALVAGVAAAYLAGRGGIFSKNLIDEAGNDEAPYTCTFCSEATLAEACDLTKAHYRHEYVSSDKAETWRQSNARGFVHLLNKDGKLCASFGVLGLASSFDEEFVKGNVTDLQLKGADVLSYDDAKRAPRLYISGVVVRDHRTHLGRKRAAAMLWAMVKYIESLYGTRKRRTLYAIAVTPESATILRKLGFTLKSEASTRADESDLFAFEITSAAWRELRQRIRAFGDASDVCQCDFS